MNPIYQFLKENNLTTKDEKTFERDYSDSAKAKELYNKAIELEESGNMLKNIERQLLYDIYFETSELMGIKPKEF